MKSRNVKNRSAAPAAEDLERPAPRDEAPPSADGDGTEPVVGSQAAVSLADRVDLASLSIAGITRRRVGWVAAALVSVWILVVFARQVGDATAAANRAVQLAADNAALAAEVQSLQGEVNLVVRPEYVAQQARGYQLGEPREIPFTLDQSVATPVDGAPGSASVRLGAHDDRRTPLESWLSLLFGPGA